MIGEAEPEDRVEVTCPWCGGDGIVEAYEREDGSWCEEECDACGGEGVMYEDDV